MGPPEKRSGPGANRAAHFVNSITEREDTAPDDPDQDREPDDDELLTDWEREFLADIESQDYDLTERQEDKLAEIEGLLEERREAWRSSRR